MSAGAVASAVQKSKRRRLNPAVKSQVNYAVRRALDKREELKISDTTIASGIDNVGSVVDLTDMTQDITEASRIANKVAPKWVELRLTLTCADATNIMRLVLIQWHLDSDAAPPLASNVLQAGLVTGSYGPWAGYNNDDRALFRVLGDWSYQMNASTANGSVIVVKKIKAAMRQIEFNGTSTTGTEKLYLIAISDSGAVSHPTVTGAVRVYYGDL